MIKNKTIVIITPFYYPEDTAIGLYTTQFSRFLATKGFKVKIITGFPNYPHWKIYPNYTEYPVYYSETINDIEIIRYKQYIPEKVTFKGRIFMMFSLFYGTFVNLRKIKNSEVVICIIPFTISILPALFLSKIKKSKLWIHIQDFEFDLALDSGIVKNNNGFFKIFKRILSFSERKLLNTADIVSSISYSMLNKIQIKSKHKEPFYFPNWVSAEKINPINYSHHSYINKNKFTLLYSGNIGEKQDWLLCKNLCGLIQKTDEVEIIIVGDGAYSNTLKNNLSKFDFVKFFPPVPYHELSDLLCSTNIHFLFQKQDVIDSIMPSKILGMMASKKPSIITGNKNSEVANIIDQSRGGFYFSGNDAYPVYETILELKNNSKLSNEMGENARLFITDKFSEQKILTDFVAKINSVLS